MVDVIEFVVVCIVAFMDLIILSGLGFMIIKILKDYGGIR